MHVFTRAEWLDSSDAVAFECPRLSACRCCDGVVCSTGLGSVGKSQHYSATPSSMATKGFAISSKPSSGQMSITLVPRHTRRPSSREEPSASPSPAATLRAAHHAMQHKKQTHLQNVQLHRPARCLRAGHTLSEFRQLCTNSLTQPSLQFPHAHTLPSSNKLHTDLMVQVLLKVQNGLFSLAGSLYYKCSLVIAIARAFSAPNQPWSLQVRSLDVCILQRER